MAEKIGFQCGGVAMTRTLQSYHIGMEESQIDVRGKCGAEIDPPVWCARQFDERHRLLIHLACG